MSCRRELSGSENEAPDPSLNEHSVMGNEGISNEVSVFTPALRGSDRALQTQQLRFNMKMYWESDFCWQEETFDRRWCMACEGNICNENDRILISTCDANSSIQHFVWEPVSGTTGKLKPYSRQDLCWEKVRPIRFRLKPCRDTNDQLVNGWTSSDKFELHPFGEPNKCLTQEHDPKAGEEIYSESCTIARADFTNLWILESPAMVPPRPPPPPPPTCSYEAFLTNGQTVAGVKQISGAYLEQKNDGNLVVRKGTPANPGSLVWESDIHLSTGTYFTILQGDGNMITYSGTPTNRGALAWKSNSVGGGNSYFLSLNCDGNSLTIFKGPPASPTGSVWTTEPLNLRLRRATSRGWQPVVHLRAFLTNGQTVTDVVQISGAYLQQENDGNLSIRKGTPSNPGSLVWESGVQKPTGSYYTILQGDGNLITWQGTPGNPGALAWKSNSVGGGNSYFLSLDCDGNTASIFKGTAASPSGSVWTTTPLMPPPCTLEALLSNGQTVTSVVQVTGAYLEQKNDGNLVVRNGTPSNPGTLVWESGVQKPTGSYYTILQGDGNLITWAGTPGNPGALAWKSNTSIGSNSYFLAINCNGNTVSILTGTPASPTGSVWTTTPLMPPPCTLESFLTNDGTITGVVQGTGAYLQQESNGNLLARKGTPSNPGSLVWESGVQKPTGSYYTILQGDGNLITWQGTPGNPGALAWKSNSVSGTNTYFLSLTCDGNALSIFKGTLGGPTGSVWTMP